ncbi:MAG TPA: hypothetical protein VN944_11080, partial [Nitrospiria bacterium]|nr:hypothetical protein [Nitrospiria bacterium]
MKTSGRIQPSKEAGNSLALMRVSPQKPLIAVTMGDPSGIGPEIILKTFQNRDIYNYCRPFIIGEETPFRVIASKTGLKADIQQ